VEEKQMIQRPMRCPKVLNQTKSSFDLLFSKKLTTVTNFYIYFAKFHTVHNESFSIRMYIEKSLDHFCARKMSSTDLALSENIGSNAWSCFDKLHKDKKTRLSKKS